MVLWSIVCLVFGSAVAAISFWLGRQRRLQDVEKLIEVFRAAHATGDMATLTGLTAEKSLGSVRSRLQTFAVDYDEKLREREDALNDMEELSRQKSELIANVSHELRTPLNAIMNIPVFLERAYVRETTWRCSGCAQTQSKDVLGVPENALCGACGAPMEAQEQTVFRGEAEEHLKYVQMFGDSSRHMLQVLNDLLSFSKLEAGKARLDLHRVDALELCARLRPSMDFVARQKGVTIVWPARREPLHFTADPVRVSQVLLNLLSNAIKFTETNGYVRLEVSQSDDGPFPAMVFRVVDNGVGIAADVLPKVFDRFRQGDVQSHHGVGLGLTISRQLVELHGGRVWAESEPGKGSVFSMLIPVTPPRVPTAEEVSVPVVSPQPVLVVEDDPVQLVICRHMLERLGFKVEVVTDAQRALDSIDALKPQFVVLDIMMPNMSGLTILERMKANPAMRDIPVMVSTSYHGNKQLVRSLGGLWLPKPWSGRDLSAALLRWELIAQTPASAAERQVGP